MLKFSNYTELSQEDRSKFLYAKGFKEFPKLMAMRESFPTDGPYKLLPYTFDYHIEADTIDLVVIEWRTWSVYFSNENDYNNFKELYK